MGALTPSPPQAAALTCRPGNIGRERIVAAHRCAVARYRAHLVGSRAQQYLRRRLGNTMPKGWPVGYAPTPGTVMVNQLRRRGFTDQEIVAAGLGRQLRDGRIIDRFRDRVMFPVFDIDGDPVGFLGRTCPGGRGPKYLNSPASPAYAKGCLLFGLFEQWRSWVAGARPVLVEGPVDVLAVAAADAGRCEFAAVAACGTALTGDQLNLLDRVCDLSSGMVSALDADSAGRRATRKVWDLLQRYPGAAGAALAAGLPTGTDPADLLERQGAGALRQAVTDATVPLADVLIEALLVGRDGGDVAASDLEHRFAVLRRAAVVAAGTGCAEQIVRLVVSLAARLNLTYPTVSGAIVDAISPTTGVEEPCTEAVDDGVLSTGSLTDLALHEKRR
ncbi:toprim domain-containing protein [Polymorphospora sp. NPDC050346]|uniref:toprim domain-containing protein n=1 Tax=Polymorphospora sp. NPDC050346 TaxID=3155780 RepID=UPI0033BFE953